MDNVKNDTYYLNKIISDIDFVIEKTKNMSFEAFDQDELTNSAVNFKFIQISENASKLTDNFVSSHPGIPWHKIKGLRNKIVHDYENVVFDMIFSTIMNDLPILVTELRLLTQ